MRKTARVMVLAIALNLAAAPVLVAPAHADNVVDSVGDWAATVGKKDLDKQAILTERKAKREAAHAQKEARRQAKLASKQMDKAGKDVKKGLGGLTN